MNAHMEKLDLDPPTMRFLVLNEVYSMVSYLRFLGRKAQDRLPIEGDLAKKARELGEQYSKNTKDLELMYSFIDALIEAGLDYLRAAETVLFYIDKEIPS